jgi:hypothetical protein
MLQMIYNAMNILQRPSTFFLFFVGAQHAAPHLGKLPTLEIFRLSDQDNFLA